MSQGAKSTHQKRSRQTRDKLLNALELLLREQDFADINVTAIAAKAGVSAASIYRRFDSKKGFIPVLFDLYLKRLEEWGASTEAQINLEGCSLREALKQVVHTGWQQVQSQAHIMRAIHLHSRGHLGLVASKMNAFEEATLGGIRALIDLYPSEIKRTNTDKTARMLAYYLNTILMEKGLFGEQGAVFGIAFSDEEFTGEVADFAYGYLTTAP